MILGVAPDAAFVAPAAVERTRRSSGTDDGSSSSDGEAAAAKPHKTKRKRERSAAAPEMAQAALPSEPPSRVPSAPAPVDEDDVAASEEEEQEMGCAPPPAGWWGASVFRWAGRLGGVRRTTKQGKGFCEDDQVAAYNAVHDAAAQGRQGLGRRDAPKKVAGARWAGTKRSFEDGDGEPSGVDADVVDADAGGAEHAAPVDATLPAAHEAATAVRKIKWKACALSATCCVLPAANDAKTVALLGCAEARRGSAARTTRRCRQRASAAPRCLRRCWRRRLQAHARRSRGGAFAVRTLLPPPVVVHALC